LNLGGRPPLWRKRGFIRLAALLSCMSALLIYLLVSRLVPLEVAIGAGCPVNSAPQVIGANAADLGRLREGLASSMPQRFGRSYEEGTIEAANAWSDDSPSGPPISPVTPRSGGYEMRWWAPNRDDVVADVFVFSGASQAHDFLKAVLNPHCRLGGESSGAPQPAVASNLYWINPEGLPQEDVFLLRGPRVYRIADVRAGAGHVPSTQARRQLAFRHIDNLACLLPEAGCTRAQSPFQL
jgi:hypothetical protein